MEQLTLETKRDITKELLGKAADDKFIDFLENVGYFDAPASTKFHSAAVGGLFEHSLQVARELIQLTEKLKLYWGRKESPAIIGLLHDMCKVDDYQVGEMAFGEPVCFEFNKERIYPGHGEKSLILLMGHIDLTEEEKMCIRYHSGAFTDKNEWEFYGRAVEAYHNVLYAHTADIIAARIKGI